MGNRYLLAICLVFILLSGCAAATAVTPDDEMGSSIGEKSLIAMMPVENLAGKAVPSKEVRGLLVERLRSRGFRILQDDVNGKFMDRHRVRYTGGLNHELGEAFRKETGTDAVLFVSLDHYDVTYPPKIALTARLVSAGSRTVILWMDSVEVSGNDSPGFLLLGLIKDPQELLRAAMEKVVDSLAGYLSGKNLREGQKVGKRFRPKNYHRIPLKPPVDKGALSIAVLPFLNDSNRSHAGEFLALQFVKHLSREKRLEVMEPGVLRQALLSSRTIMERGISLPQADLLGSLLDVDLVLTGFVTDFQDYTGPMGNPKVDFSARLLDLKTRQVVWSSFSYNRGDDRVFFFNLGKVNTAQRLASEMAGSIVEMMFETDGGSGGDRGSAPGYPSDSLDP